MPSCSVSIARPPMDHSINDCKSAEPVCQAGSAKSASAWMITLGLIATGFLVVTTTQSEAACRKALALGLDVSDSVDHAEYRLQLDGLADALVQPDVQAAFMEFPHAPVRLFIFEWAGLDSPRRIIDWTVVLYPADLERVANVLRNRPRFELVPSTGLGDAMLYGGVALSEQPECWQHVLDISGDGKSNIGVLPRDLGADALSGVTVNGLVVGLDDEQDEGLRQVEISDVLAYYLTDVIRGPGAFVEIAASFRDFEEAMARKLLRELQSLAIARLQYPVPKQGH